MISPRHLIPATVLKEKIDNQLMYKDKGVPPQAFLWPVEAVVYTAFRIALDISERSVNPKFYFISRVISCQFYFTWNTVCVGI